METLITGGAGFIGRWVVQKLLSKNERVVVIDNLSNGSRENLAEFRTNPNLIEFIVDDICNDKILNYLFNKYSFSKCIHLAAQINVQESIDNPHKAFENNVIGTYKLLEKVRKSGTKLILVGTCLVYDLATSNSAISEEHKTNPMSPYAASKLAAEELALSYYNCYKTPIVILRPFNTYGPFQKTNSEGGVISIFLTRKLNNQNLMIFGDGTQTRDLMYIEDCVDFIIEASEKKEAIGEIINAGTGKDIAIKDLARLIIQDENKIVYQKHHHPQSEIMKLRCDPSKAKKLLNWEPKFTLEEGIAKFERWLKSYNRI